MGFFVCFSVLLMAEGEGRTRKDAREEATAPPPDAGGRGADQTTGLAGPGGARDGGADQTTGLAGPRGGGTAPVGDLVDVGGQNGIEFLRDEEW